MRSRGQFMPRAMENRQYETKLRREEIGASLKSACGYLIKQPRGAEGTQVKPLYIKDLGDEASTALDRLTARLGVSKAQAVRMALISFTPEVVDLIADMSRFTPDRWAVALRLVKAQLEIRSAQESIAALEGRLQSENS